MNSSRSIPSQQVALQRVEEACLQATCRAAAEDAFTEELGIRKGKLVAAAEQVAAAIADEFVFASRRTRLSAKCLHCTGYNTTRSVVQGLADAAERPSSKPAETSYEPASDLPPSIQANREPYWQGDWRKQPYSAR